MTKSLINIFLLIDLAVMIGHPTGDMVFTNNTLLWSYVCPVGDVSHRACIMLWDDQNGVRPWLNSNNSASDYMISVADSNNVYIIERYYDQSEASHYSRLLYGDVGNEPTEILPWFRDDYRFGENGFAVIDDSLILFANYPSLYKLNKDLTAEKVYNWERPVNSIRNTNDEKLLILSDSTIWLTDRELQILETWDNLLEPIGEDVPFGGNRISDADYSEGSLYISYWGKRRFEALKEEGRKTLISFSSPWVPHHVAAGDSAIFMLSSTIAPDVTNNIEPSLWLMEEGNFELIWGDSGIVTDVPANLGNTSYKLFQNYANPFNPATNIEYSIGKPSLVKLKVYDILGNEISTLVDEYQSAGAYRYNFKGSHLSSGVYIVMLKAGEFQQVRKITLIK